MNRFRLLFYLFGGIVRVHIWARLDMYSSGLNLTTMCSWRVGQSDFTGAPFLSFIVTLTSNYHKITRILYTLEFDMSSVQSGRAGPTAAMGRAEIAAQHCGDEAEVGCNMCGYMVLNKIGSSDKPRATCTCVCSFIVTMVFFKNCLYVTNPPFFSCRWEMRRRAQPLQRSRQTGNDAPRSHCAPFSKRSLRSNAIGNLVLWFLFWIALSYLGVCDGTTTWPWPQIPHPHRDVRLFEGS